MSEKIKELHQYMLQQGLDESCKLMNQCFDGQGRPKPKAPGNDRNRMSINENINKNLKTIRLNSVGNNNDNACVNQGSVRSEATIYDNAILKCISSSSEEGMELSDESMENNEAIMFVEKSFAD